MVCKHFQNGRQMMQKYAYLHGVLFVGQQLIMAALVLLLLQLRLVQLCLEAAMLASQFLQLASQLAVVSICS